jgi:hypothetical protein
MNTKEKLGNPEEGDFLSFGDSVKKELDRRGVKGFLQTQYLSQYSEGFAGKPNLGEGLRVSGGGVHSGKGIDNYHAIKIHKDDVSIFVDRLESHLKTPGSSGI